MKLSQIVESRPRARNHRPAIITMKRGTVIEADHARLVRYPTGRTYLVVGVGPGLFEEELVSASLGRNSGFVRKLRDFYGPGRYVPAPWQDDTGWDEPAGHTPMEWTHRPSGARGVDGYSAHRHYVKQPKFRSILTINPDNIANIQWL